MSTITALRRLGAADFKRHESISIEFGEKLTVIRGPNYSGKSSIIEAILFALGGSTLVPGGRAVVVRTGAKDCEVSLTFNVVDDVYEVIRTSKDATLVKHQMHEDGIGSSETIATGHTSVNAAIEALMGMPLKDWLILSISRQSETASLMTLGASKLNQMIEQLSEADFVDRVAKRAGKHEDKAKMQLDALPAPVEIEPLEEQLKHTRASIVDLSEARENLAAEEHRIVECRKELGLQVDAARAQNDKINKAEHEAGMQGAKVELLEDELGNCGDKLEELKVNLPEIATLDEKKRRRDELKRKAADSMRINSEIVNLDMSIKAKSDWLTGIGLNTLNVYKENATVLETLRTKLIDLNQQRTTLDAMRKSAEKEYDDANRSLSDSICPACKRAFNGDEHEHAKTTVEARRQTMLTARQSAEEAHTAYKNCDIEYTTLFQKTPSGDIVIVYRVRGEELEVAKEKRVGLSVTSKEDIEKMEREANELGDRVTQLSQIKWQIEQLEEKLTAGKEEIDTRRRKMQEAMDSIKGMISIDIAPMETERESLYTQYQEKTKLISENRVKLGMMETNEKNIVQAIDTAKSHDELRKQYARQSAAYSGLKKYLRDNKSAFMSDVWDQLMILTSEFVSSVTEGDVSAIGRSDDGDFWLEEDGERRPIVAASGGQRAIAGVGLRLSLPSLLPTGSRIILLDEPSAELADTTAAALAGALKAQDRQIVLVTHREGEEFVSDSTVTLTR